MLVIPTPSSSSGLAFCYDIFFVFVSPYIFGSSVMVTVATGYSGTIHTDENFCEKHPTDKDCNMNSLPMLLIVPTFSSYLSSESLLGLGDIVLPGLLLVWAAR
jgi:Signal peptide peptidase